MPKPTELRDLKVGDRVYVGNETRIGTVIEVTPNGSTRILFDRSGRDVLIPAGDALPLPEGVVSTAKPKFDTQMGGYNYVCVGCGVKFTRKTRLDESRYLPRCQTCHAQDRKASKRQTWRDHSEQYYAQRKASREARKKTQADLEEDTAPPEPELTRQVPETLEKVREIAPESPRKGDGKSGRPMSRRLPNGRQIVWMADRLPSG